MSEPRGSASVSEEAGDSGGGGFVKVCTVADLPDVGAVLVEIDGRPICIARDSAGAVHAIDDTCTHGQVSLSEGEVEDNYIECWLHGSQFDLRTGQPISLPATVPVAVHTVKVDGDDVLVSVASPKNMES